MIATYISFKQVDSKRRGEADKVVTVYTFVIHGTSLIPRPSHHPIFDCLQYAKTRGMPGIFYNVNDVSVYLGRVRVQLYLGRH